MSKNPVELKINRELIIMDGIEMYRYKWGDKDVALVSKDFHNKIVEFEKECNRILLGNYNKRTTNRTDEQQT